MDGAIRYYGCPIPHRQWYTDHTFGMHQMEHTHNLSFGPAVTDRGIFKNSELRTPRKLCSATGFRASSEMHKEIPPKYSKVGTLPLSHSITGENFKGKDDKMLLNFQ